MNKSIISVQRLQSEIFVNYTDVWKFNKIPQATPCAANLVAPVSFTSKLALSIQSFDNKKY